MSPERTFAVALALCVSLAANAAPMDVAPFHDPAARLRLFNDSSSPAIVALTCDGIRSERTLAPGVTTRDRDCAGNLMLDAPPSVSAFEAVESDLGDRQTLIAGGGGAACDLSRTITAPLIGCRRGTASVAIHPVPGATYSWAVEGGAFLDGLPTERVTLSLGDALHAKVSVLITANGCSTLAEAVISLLEPFAVTSLKAEGTRAGEPVTIVWSYVGYEPQTQILSGPDFLEPVLIARGHRSYTYIPATGGEKDFSLFAAIPQTKDTGGRRRTAPGAASSSNCATARASTKVSIAGCESSPLRVVVTDVVEPGQSFVAKVEDVGGTVSWDVSGATPATSTGPSVTVRAPNTNGTIIKIKATVIGAGGCPRVGTATVETQAPLVCTNPTARVSRGSFDCASGEVIAEFTGTPPFRGEFSDGTQFSTSQPRLVIRVNKVGTYRLAAFRDASCKGAITGEARFDFLAPIARIRNEGNCNYMITAVVQFDGLPPFSGKWHDGVPFTTDGHEIRRTFENGGGLSEARDARCAITQQNFLGSASGPGTLGEFLTLQVVSPCQDPRPSEITLKVTANRGPLSVTWTDGVTSTSQSNSLTRVVSPAEPTDYGLARVVVNGCERRVSPTAHTIRRLRGGVAPYVRTDTSYPCATMPIEFEVQRVPSDTTVKWSSTYGTIVGDGLRATLTPSLTNLRTTVTAQVDAPGVCSLPGGVAVDTYLPMDRPRVSIPTSMKVGETQRIDVFRPGAAFSWDAKATNGSLLRGACHVIDPMNTRTCTYDYKAHTPGVARLIVEGTGCSNTKGKWEFTFDVLP